MVFALETYCAATDGRSAARIEEEVVVTATGCDVITRFPAEELLVAGRTYVRGADLLATGDDGRNGGSPDWRPLSRPRPSSSPPAFRDEPTRARASSRTGGPATASSGARTSTLADALPGRSSGLTTCRLVGGALGSTHMALTLVSLVDGHVDEHLHSYETSFYVLEGEPVLYLEGRGVEARARCLRRDPGRSAARVSLRRARALDRDGRRRGRAPTAATRSSSGRAPDGRCDAARRPRPAQPQPLPAQGRRDGPRSASKRGQAMGAPTVSGSMATAVLAYSGIAVKMLVDQRLDAQLHTMFMVDYQPGALRQPARPPVRGVVLHPRRRGRRRRERRPLHASAGRRLLDRHRLRARVLRDAGTAACGGSRRRRPGPPAAPLVPPRARLEPTSPSASPPTPRSVRREPRQRQAGGGRPRRPRPVHGHLPAGCSSSAASRSSSSRCSSQGEVYGTTHLYSGQEAIATGCRKRSRRARPRGCDVPRARPRARGRRRPAEAARRDARRASRASTAGGRAR